MTEYEPYGVRHFLRDGEPEGVSELRRRTIPLLDGSLVAKGESADTDRIDPAALAFYRTLVLRSCPAQSRPPAAYELIWAGDYYEAWQRAARAALVPERIALGDRYDPVGVPRLRRRLALAESGDLSPPGGRRRSSSRFPRRLSGGVGPAGAPDAPLPRAAGNAGRDGHVPAAGVYEVWLGGSLKPAADARRSTAARPVRSAHEINNRGGYVELGSAELDRGEHRVEVEVDGADLASRQRRRARHDRPAGAEPRRRRRRRARPGPGRRGRGRSAAGRGTGSRSRDERGTLARHRARARVAVGLVLADSLGRRPRAPRHLPRARRLGDRGHLGARRVQPRPRARSRCRRRSLAVRFGAARVAVLGLVLFAGASLVCGLAGAIGLLIAARCVQAIGGALAVCAALELLPRVTGSERRAAAVWAAAGALRARRSARASAGCSPS